MALGAIALPASALAADDAAERKDAGQYDADNTGKNVRDRDDATLTPLDQGTSEADVTATREVRKAIVDTDGLSMNARNVKVVTRDGVVTLRGPVDSTEEKARIAGLARKTAGVSRVVDQLEVQQDASAGRDAGEAAEPR
jgi:osmotically-inducible protein OsmY